MKRVGVAKSRRVGVVLLAALVVLLLTILLAAALARVLVMHGRMLKAEQQRRQACWFADSALQRAAVRLRHSSDYAGESWRVSLELDGATQSGIAEIRVSPVDGQPDQRMIEVSAIWPDQPLDRVLENRQLKIQLTSSGRST